MRFRQFVQPDGAVGRNRGDTFLFDKISNISTAGGTIAETSTIPKRNFVIRQGSLTVTEYANGIPFTQKLEKLSEVNVPDQTKVVLRNDMAKVLDSAAASQFKACKFKVIPTATNAITTDTDGTASTASTGNLSDHTARDIIDYLKKNNVPRYDGNLFAAPEYLN
jgi:N4-gp56 family major capsid protein